MMAGLLLFVAGVVLGGLAVAVAVPARAGLRADAMCHSRERRALSRLAVNAGVAPGVVAAVLAEPEPVDELVGQGDVTQVIEMRAGALR
jgi:hypothetical protein